MTRSRAPSTPSPLYFGPIGLLAAGLLIASPGLADAAAPPLMPTRDVTVVYAVQPDGAPQPQRVTVYFQGGGGLMRIDGPPAPDGSSSGDMVMNRAARTMVVVLNQPRIFMDVPENEEVRSPFVLDASMQFTPTGTGSVAGLACQTYAIVMGSGKAQACVTADGVVLSESGVDGQGNRGSLSALSVRYATLDPALFMPPPGFQRAAHPAQMGPPGASADPDGPMLSGPPAGPQAQPQAGPAGGQ